MISANRENDAALKATDRSFAKTGIRDDLGIAHTSPRGGIPNLKFVDARGNQYGNNFSANPNALVAGPTVNPNRYQGCNAAGYAMAVADASNCQTDYVQFIDLIPKAKHDNLIARATFKLNEENQLFFLHARGPCHLYA